ncbi:serine hydrolase [Lentibacter algarum]|uniref:D-alanyl-D-alanine carboxypeptidase family protein n=1 Tax=Lentibacter algarum TaxID=576131 RepID=UPI001C06FC96|nr:serine hydrolase [Lentibacter algarum]MBU2981566.1 serine hydrolase [Lentibacter algarum]
MLVIAPMAAVAAPYAAMVIDARTGKVLHSRNADTRLHPASLTKMMTLYIAFQAIENGEISLDTLLKVSKKAASEQPSKLGLVAGQRIKLRYCIRAAAVKSANDCATAIGEAISGSEAAFARRMNNTAKSLGMTRTTFKNAHGLTESGHLSTANDMTLLGRHVIYDYPQYYNLFSRRSADAGVAKVYHTNRRMLASYKGADGIKTGYTRAAGFNLVASAERGNERIIATVFGGRSTASRNAKVAELLDLGFKRAPSRARLRKPSLPAYNPGAKSVVVASNNSAAPTAKGKTIRLVTAVRKSLRPKQRPGAAQPDPVILAMKDDITEALAEAQATPVETTELAPAEAPAVKPHARPESVVLASVQTPAAAPKPQVVQDQTQKIVREVVTRVSTSGGKHWGINVGRYTTKYKAERALLKTALNEMETLDGSLRKVVKRPRGFEANFNGLSRERAELACRRLQARNVTCILIGP